MKAIYPAMMAIAAAGFAVVGSPVWANHETDERIESTFKQSYSYRTYLNDEKIKISSKEGVVVLSGTVSSEYQRSLAQDTAEELPGVRKVENNIEITGDRPAELSDAWITTKVKVALMFHRNVKATKTEVIVKDGFVTLRGEAANQAQKDLTGEYAKDIDGVKGVANEMTIGKAVVKVEEPKADNIDDPSITAQVKASLMSHRSTSAFRTKVVTRDGVVTVTGVAKNPAEKDLVTKLAEDVSGVKNVVNKMTVEEKPSEK